MKPNVERGRGVAALLGVACLGLLPASSLSAQEPRLRATLKGHTGAVVGLAFSPDSKTLASASYDGTLKSWDMSTDKERATLGEYRGCLGCVAFSPDGKTLASAAIGSPGYFPDLEDVKLWDVATGKVRTTLKGNDDLVHSVAFSPDGKTLASVNGDVTLWDLATNQERATLEGHTKEDQETSEAVYPVMSVAFSPDGKTLAAASDDMTVKVWDVATAKRSPFPGIPMRSIPWPSAQMARPWHRRAAIRPSGSGTWPPTRSGPPSRGTPSQSHPWRSARMARSWPQRATTRLSSSGMWPPARSESRSKEPRPYGPWHSARTVGCWPLPVGLSSTRRVS